MRPFISYLIRIHRDEHFHVRKMRKQEINFLLANPILQLYLIRRVGSLDAHEHHRAVAKAAAALALRRVLVLRVVAGTILSHRDVQIVKRPIVQVADVAI